MEEALSWRLLARRARGIVRERMVELWLVPHKLGIGGTVAVVVDGFISGRRHFTRVDKAEEYFSWLVRKHGLEEVE